MQTQSLPGHHHQDNGIVHAFNDSSASENICETHSRQEATITFRLFSKLAKHKFLLEHPADTTQPQFIQKNQKKPSAETTQPHLSHLPTHPCQLQSGRNGSPSAPIVHACHHAGQLPKRGTFPPTGPQHAADESSRRKADPTPSTHPRNRCGSRFAPVQDTAAHHCRPLS